MGVGARSLPDLVRPDNEVLRLRPAATPFSKLSTTHLFVAAAAIRRSASFANSASPCFLSFWFWTPHCLLLAENRLTPFSTSKDSLFSPVSRENDSDFIKSNLE